MSILKNQRTDAILARPRQLGCTVWFTGLSGAGKTTCSRLVTEQLRARDYRVELLDGDEVRENLSEGLGFSRADRDRNVRRIGFVARLLARHGVIAMVAAISPYEQTREEVRRQNGRFVCVHCRAPLAVLEDRDVKGLYARARKGEIEHFTGISDPYEDPAHPEVVVHSDGSETVEESATKVIQYLVRAGYIQDLGWSLREPMSHAQVAV